jgi:hypothetical protein
VDIDLAPSAPNVFVPRPGYGVQYWTFPKTGRCGKQKVRACPWRYSNTCTTSEDEIAPPRGDDAGNRSPQPRPCPFIGHEASAFRARGLPSAPVLCIEELHGAAPLRLGERGVDPCDRCAGALHGDVVGGDQDAKLTRCGDDITTALAGTADQAACLTRRAPPCRRRAGRIAGHGETAVSGDGD